MKFKQVKKQTTAFLTDKTSVKQQNKDKLKLGQTEAQALNVLTKS